MVAASVLGLQLGDEPDTTMKGVEMNLAIKFVYVAFPLRLTPKSSHSSKATGSSFSAGWELAGPLSFPLHAPRALLLLLRLLLMMPWRTWPPRLPLLSPPPAAPILLPASNTAAAIDLGAMTKTEQRALLARLVGLQAAL